MFVISGCLLFALSACALTEIFPEISAHLSEDAIPEYPAASEESAIQTQEPTVTEFETQLTEAVDPPVAEETSSGYTVIISREDFPVYGDPGYDYAPVGTVEVVAVYTIVDEWVDEEGNLWGKLKSGAGWVDLSLNARETLNMPPVTVSLADHKLLESGIYSYCVGDSSEYAYDIALRAHEGLSDVSFFTIEMAEECKRGRELLFLDRWDPGMPIVAAVCFPGPTSLYGLEFTDSYGVTHIYSVWESGRNGIVGISPFTESFASDGLKSDTNVETLPVP